MRTGPAPRSIAASSRLRSKPAIRAFTTTKAYDTVNATWARITVVKPSRMPADAKSSSSDAASTISGATVGTRTAAFTRLARRNR